MMPVLVPGEVGELGADAVRELTARAVGGQPLATYVEQDPMPWSVIEQGGWDLVGAPEADGGGGATLVDLVSIARVWGESCVPLPLIPSLMAKRWYAVAREHEGPVSLAVANPASLEVGCVPFGAMPGVRVLHQAEGGAALADPPAGDPDTWVPSLRTVATTWLSGLTPEQSSELAVVWAAEATGAAERLLQVSVAYAKEREQFGRPIGSFQAVKHSLSSMKVMTEAAETAVLWGAVEPSGAERASRWALDAAVTVAEKAIQVHGGMGFTWELGLHYPLRHVLTLRELVRGLAP